MLSSERTKTSTQLSAEPIRFAPQAREPRTANREPRTANREPRTANRVTNLLIHLTKFFHPIFATEDQGRSLSVFTSGATTHV